MRPALLAAALSFALGGCASNGVFLVRGVVRAPGVAGAEPLAGASVQCRDGKDGVPQYARAVTGDDGAYRIDYAYSGSWFPLVAPKGGDPHLEFSAPGYRTRLVPLRGGDGDGVVRGASGPFRKLDVTLLPEARPASK